MGSQTRENSAARLAMLAIAVALASMLCLTMSAEAAWAGGGKNIAEFKGQVISTYMKRGDTEAYGDYKSGKKATDAKSSNKQVATVKIVDGGSYNFILVTKKKAGTTKITYKLAGKAKTVTFKVVKWKNPVKTFAVGSNDYASKFKKTASFSAASEPSGKTVKVKAASGWKVQKIRAYSGNGFVKAVASGKKLPDRTYMVQVQLKSMATKAVEYVTVYY